MSESPVAFDRAPDPQLVLPFLAAAPWFAVAAGLLLAVLGAAPLGSRWTPGALAFTHLLTVGFMLQAMCGALLQFTPVAVGVRIASARLVTRTAQPLMIVGALLLAFALGSERTGLALPAALLLGSGIALFAGSLAHALWHAAGAVALAWPLWAALAGLAVTVALGIALVLGLGGSLAIALPPLTDLHALWGLGGWALVLLVFVSGTVVPMLQVTPRFPRRLLDACALAIVAALVALSLSLKLRPAADGTLATGWLLPLCAGAALYAGTVLVLLARTRRPAGDPGRAALRIAMAALLLLSATCTWGIVRGLPPLPFDPVLAAGLLGLVGVFVAAITGMLYRIVPFMIWLDLCRRLGARAAPTTARIVAPLSVRRQLGLFALAAAALLLSPAWPLLARPAGLLFAAAGAWLGIDLARALRLHRRAGAGR